MIIQKQSYFLFKDDFWNRFMTTCSLTFQRQKIILKGSFYTQEQMGANLTKKLVITDYTAGKTVLDEIRNLTMMAVIHCNLMKMQCVVICLNFCRTIHYTCICGFKNFFLSTHQLTDFMITYKIWQYGTAKLPA